MRPTPRDLTSRLRRYAEVTVFVVAWAACGWALRLDLNAFLLLGMPLTIAFQLTVRRQPLLALWVRKAPELRLPAQGVVLVAVLVVIPIMTAIGGAQARDLPLAVYAGCAVVGAGGAAYAQVHLRQKHLATLGTAMATTLALMAVYVVLFPNVLTLGVAPAGGLGWGLVSFFQYLPAFFVAEEVTFRMLDAHVSETDRGRGFPSSVFIAALWGLWHLPVAGGPSLQAAGSLLAIHVPFGVVFSLAWRRTGNLAVPVLCHALADAIRNAAAAGG